MKEKYLFCWDENYEAWVPTPEKIEDLIDIDLIDLGDEQTIRFRVCEMTEKEFEALEE